jgi:transposase InsO family protein
MRVFAFVLRQKADFLVKTLCQVCNVSTSGYYDWAAREQAGPTQAQVAEAELVVQIRLVHKASRGRYGAPRVTAQLGREGVMVNHKRVERLMALEGLQGRSARRRVRTTVSDPGAPLSPDLVERQFGQSELDLLWLGDVTYVPTGEGWLYLANVLDACSRRAIGWSIADHLRTELCLDALHAAVGTRGGALNVAGVIFHSDHGCQYTAGDYRAVCERYGITQSMGTVGDSYDNAMAESFFGSFKREVVDGEHYATKAEARAAVFEWLAWYNGTRLHSALDHSPPIEFEEQLKSRSIAA